MTNIVVVRKHAVIRSRPPANTQVQGIDVDAFEWACSMCTYATYLCAGVKKRIDEKAFRPAYVSIRPAMEGALKSLWVVGKVQKKTVPQSLETLVNEVEKVFPDFYNIFSVQMSAKDRLGNDGYRKVNGWAHADPEMWTLVQGRARDWSHPEAARQYGLLRATSAA